MAGQLPRYPILITRGCPNARRRKTDLVLVVALGWAAATLASFVALPQVIKLLRSGTTAGVSLTAWRLMLAAGVAWTGHGVVSGHLNIVVPNLLLLLSTLVILTRLRRDRGIGWVATFGPGLVLGLLNLGINVAFGPLAFAIAAGIPSVCAQFIQFHELFLTPRINGVSLPFLAMNTLNQALWLGWALLANEQSIRLAASVMGVLMAVNLTWCLLRRRGVVRARLALMSA